MTTRQILDRAVERALNVDIRLVGQWDTLAALKGNEGLVADAICALSRSTVDIVGGDLRGCDSIQDILNEMERRGVVGRASGNFETDSLFSQAGAF